jgi:hypothetical protein
MQQSEHLQSDSDDSDDSEAAVDPLENVVDVPIGKERT